ncbi:MAG: NAD(+)/NADH kinase [Bdellovibrionales bacterium]|nr:NAD(+)/NADH kinase [Bdellovibrionales bacterium]
MSEAKPIGMVIRTDVAPAVEKGKELLSWAKKNGRSILADESSSAALSGGDSNVLHVAQSAVELAERADPIVVLGGDGTFIGVARHAPPTCPVLIGVNFGTLGFLTEISPNELFGVLESVFKGTAEIQERKLLLARVKRDGKELFRARAMNETLVQKGSRERLLELDLFSEGRPIMRMRGDGMIVATPTGSTAYSLAAGGSIVYPDLEVMLLTPICAHSLTNRPLVLPSGFELSLRVPDYDGEVFLTVDGQDSFDLRTGDEVVVSRDPSVIKLVTSPSQSYYDILRTKLNWGAPNKLEHYS